MLFHDLPAAVSIPPTSSQAPKTRTTGFKRLTAFGLALLLLPMTSADLFAQQAPYYPSPQQPYSYSPQYDPGQQYQQPYAQPGYGYGQQQPGYSESQGLGPDQLDQLVAPIALNPDPLVALMLAASTYPQQVAEADQWRQSQGNVPPQQIAYGANLQNWDPSVKALTAFPQVLAEMDQNSQWTGALGNAYYNQPQDVLQAIQIMRQRAQDAGNLQSTPQEDVSDNQGYIQLAPANPDVVYVPAYNPWTVYGQPVSPYPGFSLLGAIGSFFNSGFGSSAVQFGLGTVMSAFNSSPWGLISWGLNWLTQSLFFNHSDYYTNSRSVSDWGLRYGGPRAYMAPHRELANYNRGYNRGYRGGYGQNFNRENRNQQGYGRTGYNSNYRASVYNRAQSPYAARANYNGMRNPSSDMRQAYGGNYNNRSTFDNRSAYGNNRNQSAFNGRSNYGRSNYGSGNSFNRAPSSSFARNDFARNDFNQRSNSYRGNANRGNSFMGSSGKAPHSGGFHLFGGNHNASSFGGGGSSYKAPKYKAPKMHGGGGHFGGGGHHSGGGGHHSGGHGHHH